MTGPEQESPVMSRRTSYFCSELSGTLFGDLFDLSHDPEFNKHVIDFDWKGVVDTSLFLRSKSIFEWSEYIFVVDPLGMRQLNNNPFVDFLLEDPYLSLYIDIYTRDYVRGYLIDRSCRVGTIINTIPIYLFQGRPNTHTPVISGGTFYKIGKDYVRRTYA